MGWLFISGESIPTVYTEYDVVDYGDNLIIPGFVDTMRMHHNIVIVDLVWIRNCYHGLKLIHFLKRQNLLILTMLV